MRRYLTHLFNSLIDTLRSPAPLTRAPGPVTIALSDPTPIHRHRGPDRF